jgi:hypothetical protein
MSDPVMRNNLIPPHGGYRKLRNFQSAPQVCDATVVFCDRFVEERSRTHDQMVQAAKRRAEHRRREHGSGNKKTELKQTNVARASLEELLLDYEDFLRQRGMRSWDKNAPEAGFSDRRRPHGEALQTAAGRERK